MSEPTLQSVEKALAVLELIAASDDEAGLSEIAKALSLSTSSTHRILATLERLGYVSQSAGTGKYRPTMKIVHLGTTILANTNLIKVCRPCLEEASRASGETAHLALYSQGEITFVDKVNGSNPATVASLIGQKRPAYSTGSGKVWLAFLGKAERERYLQTVSLFPYTPNTITAKDRLRGELEAIRAQGYGEDDQEAHEGLFCFAGPVFNRGGEIVATISLSGPASRFVPRKEELVRLIRAVTRQASFACGWKPGARRALDF